MRLRALACKQAMDEIARGGRRRCGGRYMLAPTLMSTDGRRDPTGADRACRRGDRVGAPASVYAGSSWPASASVTAAASPSWIGTLRPRLGYAMGPLRAGTGELHVQRKPCKLLPTIAHLKYLARRHAASLARVFRQPLIVFCYQAHLVLSIWMRHCLGGAACFLSPLPPKDFIPDRFVGHVSLLNSHSVASWVARHHSIGLLRR
jgi:hypothetical protein